LVPPLRRRPGLLHRPGPRDAYLDRQPLPPASPGRHPVGHAGRRVGAGGEIMADPAIDAPSAGSMDPLHRELLARTRDVAARVLAPRANACDQAALLPVENIRCLAEAGLLGLTVPVAFGGAGATPAVVRAYMEILAGACGLTTFVIFQHIVACRHIA